MSWLSVVGEEEDEGVGYDCTEWWLWLHGSGMVMVVIYTGAASVQVCVVWMAPVT